MELRYMELNGISGHEAGRKLLSGMVDGLLDYESPEEEKKVVYIREFLTPAAAGYASPAEG